jgi:dienelactone hydrolase
LDALWRNFVMRGLFLSLLVTPLIYSEDVIPKIRDLSRTNLLEHRAADGIVKQAQTATEWKARKTEVLAAFQKVAGPLPGNEKRCALDVKIESETDCGTYTRRLITYASEPGSRTPAYLCIPKFASDTKPAPAVLCLHPTDNQIGHGVVVGLGGKPNRQYATELAERGFITIAPNYPHLAAYKPDLKALGYASGTMKAIWDNIRALDVLDSLPYAKHESYATIGHSLGGHNSIYTALFDDRLKVIASSCGFDSFLDYYGGNIKGWTQERYMPRLADYLGKPQYIPFDFYELIACLSPRTVFICAPLKDGNFKHDSVARIVEAARPVFQLHGARDNLHLTQPDCEHDFPDEAREAAYLLITDTLR